MARKDCVCSIAANGRNWKSARNENEAIGVRGEKLSGEQPGQRFIKIDNENGRKGERERASKREREEQAEHSRAEQRAEKDKERERERKRERSRGKKWERERARGIQK